MLICGIDFGIVQSVAWNPVDQIFLASAGEDEKIMLWNTSRRKAQRLMVLEGHENIVYKICFNMNGMNKSIFLSSLPLFDIFSSQYFFDSMSRTHNIRCWFPLLCFVHSVPGHTTILVIFILLLWMNEWCRRTSSLRFRGWIMQTVVDSWCEESLIFSSFFFHPLRFRYIFFVRLLYHFDWMIALQSWNEWSCSYLRCRCRFDVLQPFPRQNQNRCIHAPGIIFRRTWRMAVGTRCITMMFIILMNLSSESLMLTRWVYIAAHLCRICPTTF